MIIMDTNDPTIGERMVSKVKEYFRESGNCGFIVEVDRHHSKSEVRNSDKAKIKDEKPIPAKKRERAKSRKEYATLDNALGYLLDDLVTTECYPGMEYRIVVENIEDKGIIEVTETKKHEFDNMSGGRTIQWYDTTYVVSRADGNGIVIAE